jgi:hypothetical protein
MDMVGNVKLCREFAPLAISDLLTIDPDKESRLDRTKMNDDVSVLPMRRDHEFLAIRTNRVISLGDIGWVRVIRKFVWVIKIDRNTVAIKLPIGRYLYLIPLMVIKIQ